MTTATETPATVSATPRKVAQSKGVSKKDVGKKGKRHGGRDAAKVGTVYEREYLGKKLTLTVVGKDGKSGFRFGKKVFPSMTGAAKAATGYRAISGPAFWGDAAR